jgi:dihydroorotate dehydrogenase electron transfer subunit
LKQVTSSVISNDEIMPGVYLIWLESLDIEPAAQPGQFVMVRCGDYLLPRPLSIHRLADKGGKLALLFNVMGKGTHWLSQRKPGDMVELFGPLGNGFSIHPNSQNLLLVAGGIGVAPLYFLAQEALNQGYSVTLLLGASNASQLYPRHLLPSEAKLITTTEDGTNGQKGMITELLPDFVGWADQVFACGPIPMYRDMANKYHSSLKDKSVQVSLEMRMGCGLGVCYGCTVKTKRGLKQACRDGPVFDLDDVLWDELSCF